MDNVDIPLHLEDYFVSGSSKSRGNSVRIPPVYEGNFEGDIGPQKKRNDQKEQTHMSSRPRKAS